MQGRIQRKIDGGAQRPTCRPNRGAKHRAWGGYGRGCPLTSFQFFFLNKHVKEALIEHPTTRNDGMEHPTTRSDGTVCYGD